MDDATLSRGTIRLHLFVIIFAPSSAFTSRIASTRRQGTCYGSAISVTIGSDYDYVADPGMSLDVAGEIEVLLSLY